MLAGWMHAGSLRRRALRVFVALVVPWLASCASLSPMQHERALNIAAQARSEQIDCSDMIDHCALQSPLHALGDKALAASTPDKPTHYALMIDQGEDSLLARLNLIRSAKKSIDLQTYIFDTDDSSRIVLDELIAAAKRGVQVRVLIDQLSAIGDVQILAALAGTHQDFALRVYNPTFNKATLNYFDYAGSVLCCFRRFNQRMHTKLLLVDDQIGITGGRNYQDDYFDWDSQFDFRDRDVLIAGPAAQTMAASFEEFWNARRSVPVERLNDVGRVLLKEGVPALPPEHFQRPARVAEMRAAASDAAIVERRLVQPAMQVGKVDYIADLPQKHRRDFHTASLQPTPELETLIEGAQRDVLLQTPYLVLSKKARKVFAELHKRATPPTVTVATNSLASTDNPIVYAVSHKYKRMYLRELGFHIYELKPYPVDEPIDYAGLSPENARDNEDEAGNGSITGEALFADLDADGKLRKLRRAESRPSFLSSGASSRPVPLNHPGLRIGLHAKSMVIDGHIALIGTHNFDPRSVRYNTEAVVIIDDAAFAQRLQASIDRDMDPINSWTIAKREGVPILSDVSNGIGAVSSSLPVFDLWPFRYATSYEFVPGPDCLAPLSSNDSKFYQCYHSVGDFPEVSLGPKTIFVRVLMAFGAGLVPIL